MKTHRLARVAEVIREVASETVLFHIRDPRVKMTTVTRAEVSADLQHGKVYVSIMGDEKDQAVGLKALNHAAGFVQSRLADRMKTRFLPVLTFVLDEGVKNSLEVNRLLAEARALGMAGLSEEDRAGGRADVLGGITDTTDATDPEGDAGIPADQSTDEPHADGHQQAGAAQHHLRAPEEEVRA